METYRIKIGHQSPMIGAHWCHPIGWQPGNRVADCQFVDGAWRKNDHEIAGIIYFTHHREGEEIDVPLDDLRVVACGEWKILEKVMPTSK